MSQWPEINPKTREYYDRKTTEASLADIRTMIDEWSYEEDPHGYCHTRPMLVRLVEAAERGISE